MRPRRNKHMRMSTMTHWGETYEDEYDGQWEESDKQEQYDDAQDNYNAEVEYEDDKEEQGSPRSDDYDEDDQDTFMWHSDNPDIMEAYISEEQIISCDVVDELPGNRTDTAGSQDDM